MRSCARRTPLAKTNEGKRKMKKLITFRINGDLKTVAVDVTQTLLDLIRDDLGLTGTNRGCNEGECGACTVLLDGKAIASCTKLAVDAEGAEIVTIEGLAKNGVLHPIQQAFIDKFAVQCGFCTPGMIMSTLALLNENPNPTEEEIRDALRGNICRCTGYTKIIDAIQEARDVLLKQEK